MNQDLGFWVVFVLFSFMCFSAGYLQGYLSGSGLNLFFFGGGQNER
jgi:hypothetical protein